VLAVLGWVCLSFGASMHLSISVTGVLSGVCKSSVSICVCLCACRCAPISVHASLCCVNVFCSACVLTSAVSGPCKCLKVCVCMCVCVYVCVCVCVCVFLS
jgi:hypothetical protein